MKRYPKTAALQKLFPSFTLTNKKLYAQKTIVLDHPGGEKAQKVEEFKFMDKNKVIMKTEEGELEVYPNVQVEKREEGKQMEITEEEKQEV